MIRVKCSACKEEESVSSRIEAKDWMFIEATMDGRVIYQVFCKACRPKWAAQIEAKK